MKNDLATMFRNIKMQTDEPGDLSGVLRRIGSVAQSYFKADFCVILAMNPVTQTFLREKPAVIGNLAKSTLREFKIPRETGLASLVLGKKILLVEEGQISNYKTPITDIEKIRTFAAFGLFTNRHQRPLAVIYLDYKKPKKLDMEFQSDLMIFVEFASAELQNTWYIRRYREIVKIGQDINESLENIDHMFDKVFKHMKGILDVSYYFSLTTYDRRTSRAHLYLVERGQKSVRENYLLKENSISLWVIKNLTAVRIDNLGNTQDLPFGIQPFHVEGTASEEKSLLFVPLRLKDHSLGVLSIQHPDAGHYDEEDRQILELLANHMALALNNHGLLEDLRTRRIEELESLRQIDKEISRTLDSELILHTILKLTAKRINADTGVILLLNKKINAIEAKATIGENLPPLGQQVYPLDQSIKGIAKTAFEIKTTIRIDNVRKDSKWKDKYSEISKSTNSEMDVPLILGDEAIGVMNFESNREAAFNDDDRQFVETLAGQAVIAIKNAFDYERAQRVAKEREALIDIVNKLISQTDSKEIFLIILAKALEITKSTNGSIKSCDEERRELKIVVASGIDEETKKRVQTFDEGVIGKAVREKQWIKIDNLSTHPLKEQYLKFFEERMESELAVPILEGDKVLGVINLESENPYHFEDDDIELTKSLASLCAIALKNADIIHQKQLASIGLITGDIAHKMNSPLSKIRKQVELIEGNCQEILASNDYLADKIAQIDKMLSETLKMIQTKVNDAKRSFAEIEKTSLKLCLKKALNEIGLQENISIEDYITTQEDKLEVLATPELTNVFHNLISNAIRAMPDGGKISITIETINEKWIIISVEDTGKGIPEEVASLVYRVSERGEAGHGFGLPLTKAYIEMIGGIIDTPVKGKSGLGAKFTIHLRKAQVSD